MEFVSYMFTDAGDPDWVEVVFPTGIPELTARLSPLFRDCKKNKVESPAQLIRYLFVEEKQTVHCDTGTVKRYASGIPHFPWITMCVAADAQCRCNKKFRHNQPLNCALKSCFYTVRAKRCVHKHMKNK